MRHGSSDAAGLPLLSRAVAGSSGHPLDADTRQHFQLRFGHDFSAVRVHNDSEAHRTADALGANAFTVGEHIVFGADRYAPRSQSGRQLIAHELAHVVQQRQTGVVAVQRQAVQGAPPGAGLVPEGAVERISSLVDRFKVTSDEKQRLAIAEDVLKEVSRVAATPGIDAHTRALLVSQTLAVREELDKAKGSSAKRGGAVAGGIVLAGGGPEDVLADILAVAVFFGIVVVALFRSAPKVDPGKVQDLLDQIRDSLRKTAEKQKPEQKPEPEQKPKPTLPLGPDIGPRPQLHQGNIHVQGDDVRTPPNFAWSQPVPATKAQGLGGLAQVKSQCTPSQLRYRDVAFTRAERWINTTVYTAPPPLPKPFRNPEVIGDPDKGTRRVDIEIIRGTAFI